MADRAARMLAENIRTTHEQLTALAKLADKLPIEVAGQLIYWADLILKATNQPSRARPQDLSELAFASDLASPARRQELAALVDQTDLVALGRQAEPLLAELGELAENLELAGTVQSDLGVTKLSELCTLATIELVALCYRVDALPTRNASALAVRGLAQILAIRYPGQTIELRVPPFAAVQLAYQPGPKHTRGTPPNVIELSPEIFVRIAAGRLSLQAAKAAHQVSSSGAHADELAAMLPILNRS